MAKAQKVVLSPEEKAEAKQKRWAQIKRDKWMYLLLLPEIGRASCRERV